MRGAGSVVVRTVTSSREPADEYCNGKRRMSVPPFFYDKMSLSDFTLAPISGILRDRRMKKSVGLLSTRLISPTSASGFRARIPGYHAPLSLTPNRWYLKPAAVCTAESPPSRLISADIFFVSLYPAPAAPPLMISPWSSPYLL